MDAPDYKEVVVKIRAELGSLEVQQEDIECRIARLKQALIGLVPLSEPRDAALMAAIRSALYPKTLTDAARQILQAADDPLTPTEIRQQLIDMGRDLSKQKNVMASVHALLKRLVASGEIETKDNGLTYGWNREPLRARLAAANNLYDANSSANTVPQDGTKKRTWLSGARDTTKTK